MNDSPFIEIKNEDDIPLSFDTIDALTVFIDAEIDAWSWVKPTPNDKITQPYKSVINEKVVQKLSEINQQIQKIPASTTDKVAEKTAIKKYLNEMYVQGTIPTSLSPDFSFLLVFIKAEKVNEALHIAAFLVDPRRTVAKHLTEQDHYNLIQLYLHRHSIDKNTIEAATISLDKLKDNHQIEINNLKQENIDLILEKTKIIEQFNTFQLEASQQIEDIKTASEIELKKIKEDYNVNMALTGPVNVWKKKRAKNRNLAIFFTTILSGYAYMVGSFGYENLIPLIPQISNITAITPGITGIITLFLIFIGVAYLPARNLMMQIKSQIHLYNDAQHRVSATESYITLFEGEYVSKGELEIILGLLFSPISDGMIKDDPSPFISHDIIKAIMAKK